MAEYIEREALKKRFAKRLDWLKKDIHDEYSGALYDCCEVDADLIDEIPAADVVPVVHGRWNADETCSLCGEKSTEGLDATKWNYWLPNYCPNCGAKMDGGDENV